MNEHIATATRFVEEIVSRTQESFEEVVKASQQQAAKTGQALQDNVGQLNELSRKNLDAVIVSGQIAAQATEDASQATLAFVRKSSEDSLSVFRKMAAAGSLTEAAEIQQSFARDSVAALVSETERLSVLVATTARDVLSPINERLNATIAMLSRPLAA